MEFKFIGVTGGVGSGKSAALSYIEKHYKAEIYYSDDVARQIRKKGTPLFDKLISLLSSDILNDEGEIDNKKMANMIFNDEKKLEKVNALIHPAVREYIIDKLSLAQKEGNVELFFIEAALLIETGYNSIVDEMWYVHADENVRIARLMESRGYSSEKAKSIINSQLSEKEFRASSDFVLDNSKGLEELYKAIDEKLEGYTWRP